MIDAATFALKLGRVELTVTGSEEYLREQVPTALEYLIPYLSSNQPDESMSPGAPEKPDDALNEWV